MSDTANKFYIIDGSGFLYRAFYAFPTLTNENWENINVIYGFFRMLFKIFTDRPEYLAIARDSPVKTLRHEIFTDYKANRPATPDDLRYQVPIVKRLVQELWIPNLQVPWYEADDIIGTLVNHYKKENNLTCNIISCDKDLKQLLEGNVIFFDPMKDTKIDIDGFIKEFWFWPKNIIDYLSLTWDSSDNIPWVAWIWTKKATELVLKYQDLDTIYAHLDEISWDTKNKLTEWKEKAYSSKKLIELMTVPWIESNNLKDFNLNIDFAKYNQVLVNDNHFNSFTKILHELKNKLTAPIQMGLF